MSSEKPWSGRFSHSQAALAEEYTESISYDYVLYPYDIKGSKAHAAMLARQGVISHDDARQIAEGLDQVKKEIENGQFEWREDLEDIHMNIESRLTEIIGPAGRKLHTGRSRNDQTVLDLRLYISDALDSWSENLVTLVKALREIAAAHTGTVMPGYTHTQPAQPVTLAQTLLAYAFMFKRDYARIRQCRERVNVSPLGAAALAGSTFPLDPQFVADELGMSGVFDNSMDAVSDRDFVIEPIFTASLLMGHMSRLCAEIILWANPSFAFITLPDAYSTGSSIMPQKKNPDVPELMRGKTGRVYGALISLLTMIKGLPLSYHRDFQEDKQPFFETDRIVSSSLAIMAEMLANLIFNPGNMRRRLSEGYLNATEMADYLASKGMPFRTAHQVAGAAVAYAEKMDQPLETLSLEELRKLSPLIEEDIYPAIKYESAVKRRETPGGTGPASVDKQLQTLGDFIRQAEEAP